MTASWKNTNLSVTEGLLYNFESYSKFMIAVKDVNYAALTTQSVMTESYHH